MTDAAAHAGTRRADLLDPDNTASGVWADTGYRSKKNEDLLRRRMLGSHIHRKKPARRPMPARTARANAKTSAVRAHIAHVFAEVPATAPSQPTGLPSRTPPCELKLAKIAVDGGVQLESGAADR